ncbi:MAG: Crp/Fnr family transcriptional regulator [Burkholderiaceae bacterium]|nr:Crp/Fnr family transcriptional regulator [Burkholderiaceae bacterium]
MLSSPAFLPPSSTEDLAPGTLLRQRHQRLASVLYLDSGRVQLGVCDNGLMRHLLGTVQGPFWLDAADALLGLSAAVDMVAETPVRVRRLAVDEFLRGCAALPASAQALLKDMARTSRQQTELSVSRLVQDAEARCAQWLLQHAQPDPSGAMRVTLHQRKRLIAAQLGIAPETFSRVLRHLREHGLIAGTGKVLSLLQPRALQAVAGG